jgi:hypothetical protein
MSKRQNVSILHLPTLIKPQELVLNKMTNIDKYLNNKYSSYLRSMGQRVNNWYEEELKQPIYLSPISLIGTGKIKFKRTNKINLDRDRDVDCDTEYPKINLNNSDILKDSIDLKKNTFNIKLKTECDEIEIINYSSLNLPPVIGIKNNPNTNSNSNSIPNFSHLLKGKDSSITRKYRRNRNNKLVINKTPKYNQKSAIENINKVDIKFSIMRNKKFIKS